MIMGLALNAAIAALLLVTIGYCWRLNTRINQLRQGRHEMNQFLTDFNSSIQRAEWNIHELKQTSQITDETLRAQLDKGRLLANDLTFLIERADNVADVLEQYIKHTRNLQRSLQEEMQQYQTPRRTTPTAPTARQPMQPAWPPAQAQVNQQPSRQNPNANLTMADAYIPPQPPRQHNATAAPITPTKPPARTPMEQNRTNQQPPATGLNPVKRQALETLLEQIAARKAAANQPGRQTPIAPQPLPVAPVELEPAPRPMRHNIET